MCGIVGVIGDPSLDDASFGKLLDTLAHRGPDGSGKWNDTDLSNSIWLGHRLLAIRGEYKHPQPVLSKDDRYVLCFNGAIYNFRVLQADLLKLGIELYDFSSDTEVLISAFSVWGVERTLEKIDGMFAIAVFDRLLLLLTIAVDRFGEKPLYYGKKNGIWMFASEPGPLNHHFGSLDIDPTKILGSLDHGLIGNLSTVFADFEILRAGMMLTVNLVDYEVSDPINYWKDKYVPQRSPKSARLDYLVDELDQILTTEVERRLDASVDVGCVLSGGLDSSLIAAVAEKIRPGLTTYTLGVEGVGYNELNKALRAAEYIGVKNVNLLLPGSLDLSDVVSCQRRISAPISDPSLLPTLHLMEEVSHHSKVILSGDGADEMFLGYAPFRAAWMLDKIPKIPIQALGLAINLLPNRLTPKSGYLPLQTQLKQFLLGLNRDPPGEIYGWMSLGGNNLISEVLVRGYPSFLPKNLESLLPSTWDRIDATDDYFMTYFLQDLVFRKVDYASMAYGIEVRTPFTSLSVYEFAKSIPRKYKLDWKAQKIVLRQLASRYLPGDLVVQKKQGFAPDMLRYVRNSNIRDLDSWLSNGIINPSAIKKIFVAIKEDNQIEKVRLLWHLLAIENFSR